MTTPERQAQVALYDAERALKAAAAALRLANLDSPARLIDAQAETARLMAMNLDLVKARKHEGS